MTLTEFLLARIAEDEATGRFDMWDTSSEVEMAAQIGRDAEAKRRIVELHQPDRHLENWYWTQRRCVECGGQWHVIPPFGKPTEIGPEQGCQTLRALAAVYADHPDYRAEWKP